MPSPEPNLARPFAPHRLRIYLGAVVFMSAVMAITTTGTALGVLPANMTLDVVGNIALALPLVTIPFVVFWDAPGENRSRLETAAELTLVYLPFTAFSQLTYELTFLVGHVFGVWSPTSDPGWKWLWWQFGLADTRYWGDNPFIFGVEFAAVLAGAVVFCGWYPIDTHRHFRRGADAEPVAGLRGVRDALRHDTHLFRLRGPRPGSQTSGRAFTASRSSSSG